MTWRFPGRQWRSRVAALGGANMSPPIDLDAAIIPYAGAPAAWTYPSSSLAFTVGVPITPQVPTVTRGEVIQWGITTTMLGPLSLPAGLSIDPFVGTISGTPTTPTASRVYRVGTRSKGGAAYGDLTIVVS